jgi:hypothetical protein
MPKHRQLPHNQGSGSDMSGDGIREQISDHDILLSVMPSAILSRLGPIGCTTMFFIACKGFRTCCQFNPIGCVPPKLVGTGAIGPAEQDIPSRFPGTTT